MPLHHPPGDCQRAPEREPRLAEPAPAKAGVVPKLKTAWRDGTSHHVMTPMEFMQRLAARVPRPRLHLIRFHGVLAANAKLRKAVVPVPMHRMMLAAMLAWAHRDAAESEKQLAPVKAEAAVLACYQIAQVHGFRHETDASFEWLEKCIDVRDPGVFSARTDRLFKFLHGDSRWPSLMRRLGFQS